MSDNPLKVEGVYEEEETETNNFVFLDKEELLNKLYKLNEDNLVLNEQIKQYRKIIELIESKMNDINSTNNEKRERIYGLIQNIKKLIQSGGSRKKSKKHTKRRSKRLEHACFGQSPQRRRRPVYPSNKHHSKRSKHHRSK